MEEVFLRGQFTFYRSFYEALQDIEDPYRREETYDLICRYALDCEPPEMENLLPIQRNTFRLIRPVLDAARKKAEGGAKHGKEYMAKEDTGKIPERYREDTGNKGEEETEKEIELEKELEIEIEPQPQTEGEGDTCAGFGGSGGFEKFWNLYPKKVGKERAREKFAQVDVPLDVLLDAIRKQIQSSEWTKEGRRYIPNPDNWLENRRWEDELPVQEDYGREVKASGIMGQAERDALARMLANG